MYNRFVLSVVFLVLLSSCSINKEAYVDNRPALKVTEFFNGALCAWGTVSNRSGEVQRRFIAQIQAESTSEAFSLDESFQFDDGEQQKRLWQFKKHDSIDEQWIGNAGDVVGEASAEIIGNAMALFYELEVPYDDDTLIVAMEDWLHLIDERTMLGTTTMTKWGVQVGVINIVIQKQDQGVISC